MIGFGAGPQLLVNGNVAFGGEIAAELLPGFIPQPFDSFAVMEFVSGAGTFDNEFVFVGDGAFSVLIDTDDGDVYLVAL